jgi:hypothetical protein
MNAMKDDLRKEMQYEIAQIKRTGCCQIQEVTIKRWLAHFKELEKEGKKVYDDYKYVSSKFLEEGKKLKSKIADLTAENEKYKDGIECHTCGKSILPIFCIECYSKFEAELRSRKTQMEKLCEKVNKLETELGKVLKNLAKCEKKKGGVK